MCILQRKKYTIGAMIVAFWYYKLALSVGKNAMKWVISGILVYYIARISWTFLVLKPVMGQAFFHHRSGTGIMIEASAIIVGLLVAALVRSRILLDQSN